jgi:hypothetical protein
MTEKEELQSEAEIIVGPHCPACDSKEWVKAGLVSEELLCARCNMSMADSMEFPPLGDIPKTPMPVDVTPDPFRLERLVFAILASPWVTLYGKVSGESFAKSLVVAAVQIEEALSEHENKQRKT